MSDKKQYPYRYGEESENLFQKGFILYKKENTTPKFSLNQLFDICLRKAIVHYPEQFKEMEATINKLKKQLKASEEMRMQSLKELNDIKELLTLRQDIENKLKSFTNP